MKFEMRVQMDNAAFDDQDGSATIELARILRDVAAKLGTLALPSEKYDVHGTALDCNGNTVCFYSILPG